MSIAILQQQLAASRLGDVELRGYFTQLCESLKEGLFGCKDMRMPMDKLDGIVIGEVTMQMLQPEHFFGLLCDYHRTALEREKLPHGSPDLRQAYVRLLPSAVRVNDREIRISGSKAVLAWSAAGGVAKTTPAVFSFD